MVGFQQFVVQVEQLLVLLHHLNKQLEPTTEQILVLGGLLLLGIGIEMPNTNFYLLLLSYRLAVLLVVKLLSWLGKLLLIMEQLPHFKVLPLKWVVRAHHLLALGSLD